MSELMPVGIQMGAQVIVCHYNFSHTLIDAVIDPWMDIL